MGAKRCCGWWWVGEGGGAVLKKKHGKKRKKGEGVFHHGPPLALPLDDGGASDRLDADPPSGAPSDGGVRGSA